MYTYIAQLFILPSKKLKVQIAFLGACLLLGACTSTAGPDERGSDGDSGTQPLDPRTLTTWTVDPKFDIADIKDDETLAWYRRVKLEIAKDRTRECLPPETPPEGYPWYPSSATIAACSGVKHYVGRGVQSHITSLLTLFRITGDIELLEEVDRVMEIAKSQLRDTDGDGYRNWRWLSSIDSDDFNPKEDTLAHGYIPQVIYVFQRNADRSTSEHDYKAHADEWLAYLRDEFEAKWAPRFSTADHEGLPVSPLFHPYIEMLRYNVYMAKLYPEDARYQRMHQRLAATVLNEFKTDTTKNGEAFVWSHMVREERFDGDPDRCLHFQMATYPNRTMQVFMDLALEGYLGFSNAEAMLKLSKTLSESILDQRGGTSMYKDVGGIRNSSLDSKNPELTYIDGWCFQEAPLLSNLNPAASLYFEGNYVQLNFAFMAAFAKDEHTPFAETQIYKVNRHIYGDPTSDLNPLKSVSIPAAMAFTRLYNLGGFALRN